MNKPQSPIHRPLDENDPPASPPVHSRIALLAQLDSRSINGLTRSLGPGGASGLFTMAVSKALVDEMADQLRGGGSAGTDSDIGQWAAAIIAAFKE